MTFIEHDNEADSDAKCSNANRHSDEYTWNINTVLGWAEVHSLINSLTNENPQRTTHMSRIERTINNSLKYFK